MASSPTPPPISPLLTALRTATAPAHRALEERTGGSRILDGSLTLVEYERLIRWQAAAHRVLEPYAVIEAVGFHSRSRLASLPETPLPTLDGLQLGDDLPSRIGVAYVLEGGSLGGSLILRKLRANPRVAAAAPFPFYAWQAAHGLQQWRAFVASLATLDLSEAEIDRAAQSAVHTFELFGRLWLEVS